MKLSELLEAALAALQNQRASCADYGDGYGRKQVESDMCALRTIAPALVHAMRQRAIVQRELNRTKDYSKHATAAALDSLEACFRALDNALERAGVSCE